MNKNRYFIDANIIMYAVGAEHPLKQPCIQILRDCVTESLSTYTNVEVLQEILHRYSRMQQRLRAIQVSQQMMTLVTTVLPVNADDFSYALQLHQ